MSKPIDNGGPAFPQPMEDFVENPRGMSLRQYYASAALPAIIRLLGPEPMLMLVEREDATAYLSDSAAKMAFKFADAMIATGKEDAP